ncbi:MAG: sulfotransferase [Candidatus Aenigmarchaeota archaeon]|nr:sulfotransferase [Candidatus Aenigmarchaeota archaeon]
MDKKGQHEFESRYDKIRNIFECDQFFVCGAPKSGTTWFQRLLDSHPEVVCSGEGHFTEMMVLPLSQVAKQYNKRQALTVERVYEGKPYYQGLRQDELEFIAMTMIGLVMSQRRIPEGTKCIGDKTPRYTFRLNMLGKIFPQAKFIHVVRDARDVITSTCHHAYRAGQRGVIDKTRPEYFSYSAQCAKVWADNVRSAERFGEEHPERYHMVRYEDMHSEPEDTLSSILQFLGVSTDEEIIRECISKNEFKLFSGGREKGEEDKDSYFRSGTSGGWEGFLTKSALKGVYTTAGGLLKKFGYLDTGTKEEKQHKSA